MVIIVIAGSIVLEKRDAKGHTEEEPPNPTEAPIGENGGSASILTAAEEQSLQDEAMLAARQCMEFYRESEIAI